MNFVVNDGNFNSSQILFFLLSCTDRTSFGLLTVIFEEAGEILESHVVACLTPFTQHVIMIGDQMQLRPHTLNSVNLKADFMKISLFERLIRGGMQYTQLEEQYRMRPIIADLLCPSIYAILKNAPPVLEYNVVRAMHKNLYFLNIDFSQDTMETKETVISKS